jgi:DNA repair exonuclease SbcCD nuclease subunit
MLPADGPATVEFAEYGVAIHGQGFARRDVAENLALAYPAPLPGRLNIGLLHTAAGRGGHENYAPCTPEQLAAHGYDYWALGHVHAREVIAEAPWIVFPGNLQGRDVNEAGAKGATLVTVTDGAIAGLAHHVLDVVRWARIAVDLSGAENESAALERLQAPLAAAVTAAQGRLLALRIELSGACAAHAALAADPTGLREQLRAEAVALAGGAELWLEEVRLATRPLASPTPRDGALGTLLAAIDGPLSAELAAALREHATALLTKAGMARSRLPPDHPALRLAAGEIPDEWLDRARAMLRARLGEG